jgi:hypothetical protein
MPGLKLFELGTPAGMELQILAEEGNPVPLQDLIQPHVFDSAIANPTPLPPGDTVSAIVRTRGKYHHISVASMLVPTNDAFFAVNGVAGPKGKRSILLYSPAYDAGSEANDEICSTGDEVDGPCGYELMAGEGYVHIHAGIHGVVDGTLNPADHDWRNPVARIEITRIRVR